MTNAARSEIVRVLRDMYEVFVQPETQSLREAVAAATILAEQEYVEPKVGDIIKSHDFHFVNSCYRVGRVVEVDENFIYCNTLKRVFEGQNRPVPEDQVSFRTPRPGQMIMDEVFTRVEFLG